MNGHPRDQAKVSLHDRRWLVRGSDGQAGDAKYNTWNMFALSVIAGADNQ